MVTFIDFTTIFGVLLKIAVDLAESGEQAGEEAFADFGDVVVELDECTGNLGKSFVVS